MFCAEFEDRLTDYLDGALAAEEGRAFGEHALRCPVCHELLNEVRNAVAECRAAVPPAPSPGLEARVLLQTAPETAMACEDFEQHLTDYLDGFLPAAIYHRWERHAALCARCSDLPGQVVRAIGACYSYISEERPLPAGLHARILQATLGTTEVGEVRAPLPARVAEWLRGWLDVVVSPQLATVASMVLLAVLVGTSTVSDDGSIGGVYRASLRLAEKTYEHSSDRADELKRVTEGLVTPPAQSGATQLKAEPRREGAKPSEERKSDQQKR